MYTMDLEEDGMDYHSMILAKAPGTLVQPWDLWRTNGDLLQTNESTVIMYTMDLEEDGIDWHGNGTWGIGSTLGPLEDHL